MMFDQSWQAFRKELVPEPPVRIYVAKAGVNVARYDEDMGIDGADFFIQSVKESVYVACCRYFDFGL